MEAPPDSWLETMSIGRSPSYFSGNHPLASIIAASWECQLKTVIKSTKKEARQASGLDAKVALHKKAKELERQRNDKRRRLFETQDEVDARKDGLIEDIEQRLKQRMEDVALFTIRWCVR